MKKSVVIAIVVVVLIIAALAFFVLSGKNTTPAVNKKQPSNSNLNMANSNLAANENASLTNVVANTDVTYEGKIFLKGYDTPSESYGMLTTEGFEIGLGKYDSMREQLREYQSKQVRVIFSKVCHTTDADCCLTLFSLCGTVKSWEPIK